MRTLTDWRKKMTWVYSAVVAVTTIYTATEAKKAKKKAIKKADEDAAQARKAELFAETEGEGIGSLGKVSLEVDADLPRFPALKNPETTENKTNGENQDPCGQGSISFDRISQLSGVGVDINFF